MKAIGWIFSAIGIVLVGFFVYIGFFNKGSVTAPKNTSTANGVSTTGTQNSSANLGSGISVTGTTTFNPNILAANSTSILSELGNIINGDSSSDDGSES